METILAKIDKEIDETNEIIGHRRKAKHDFGEGVVKGLNKAKAIILETYPQLVSPPEAELTNEPVTA